MSAAMVIGDEKAEKALGEKTRKAFTEAAQGKTEQQAEGTRKAETPRQDHDLEPSLDEKKQGAAMDRSSSQKLFEQIKASRAQEKTRGFDLGR